MRTDRYKHDKHEPVRKKGSRALPALLILITLLLIVIAIAVVRLYKTAEDSIAISFTEENPSLEFGGKYAAADYVRDSVGEVKPSRRYLKSGALGESKITYIVSKPVLGGLLKPSKEYSLSYTVVDTTPPVKLMSGDGTVIGMGADFDIKNYISYGDNADPEPKLKVKGKVDTETPGTYTLRISVTDASGNKTSWKPTVEVVEEFPESENDTKHIKFKNFIKTYKEDGRSFGIDVSDWQDEIDFDKVRASGCEFVMIRAGFSSGDDKIVSADKRFRENLEKAKAAGLKVGLYLYSSDNDEEIVRASADWVVKQLDGESLDLPVAFDWEDFTEFPRYKMSFYELNRLYDAFADQLSKSGYECMLYSSRNYLDGVWTDTGRRPVWLAHYTDKTDYKGPYRIWQVSNTGRIKGISGDVDLDILYEQ